MLDPVNSANPNAPAQPPAPNREEADPQAKGDLSGNPPSPRAPADGLAGAATSPPPSSTASQGWRPTLRPAWAEETAEEQGDPETGLSSDPADGAEEMEATADSAEPQEEPWKQSLRDELEHWLASLDEDPALEEESCEVEDVPDLTSFFEQLAVLNTEARKSNRRIAESLSQWNDTLARFEAALTRRPELSAPIPTSSTGDARLARSHCLTLVELYDRMQRLGTAFAMTPEKPWWGGEAHWRKAWETQRQAFAIMCGHFEALLRKEGVTRIETRGQLLDPARMVAVAAAPASSHPHQTVLEEIAAGYLRDGELLRVAQVKVALNKNATPGIPSSELSVSNPSLNHD